MSGLNNYPPGVSGNEDYITGNHGPCDVCGHAAADCICPECPVCGQMGDPECYEKHGLARTAQQCADKLRLDAERDAADARYVAQRASQEPEGE